MKTRKLNPEKPGGDSSKMIFQNEADEEPVKDIRSFFAKKPLRKRDERDVKGSPKKVTEDKANSMEIDSERSTESLIRNSADRSEKSPLTRSKVKNLDSRSKRAECLKSPGNSDILLHNNFKSPSKLRSRTRKVIQSSSDSEEYVPDDTSFNDTTSEKSSPAAKRARIVSRELESHSREHLIPIKPPIPSPMSAIDLQDSVQQDPANLVDEKKSKGFNYSDYLARKSIGCKAPGSKPIPKGSDTCLLGLTFVFSGVLESQTREEAVDLVKLHGGRVTTALSSKTSYLVLGDDPSNLKLKKAKSYSIPVINEDQLLNLIILRTKDELLANMEMKSLFENKDQSLPQAEDTEKEKVIKSEVEDDDYSEQVPDSRLWVDKYRPESHEDLIGNVGSSLQLSKWLANWPKFMKQGFKNIGVDEGATCKAALLSGPPGIGKTTTAHMVARLAGYSILEFNASDARSAKALNNYVLESTKSHSIDAYFSSNKMNKEEKPKKHLLIMDEIDGMSRGDSGGASELVRIIKDSKVPVICLCNDRQSPNVRTIANISLDIRFRRPTVAQAEKKIMSIAEKEGLKVETNVVSELISSCSGDIRQVLMILSTYKLSSGRIDFKAAKKIAETSKKNVSYNLFDLAYKIFDRTSQKFDVDQKLEYFFQDFSIIPLMVQENYPLFSASTPVSGVQRNSKLQSSALVSQFDLSQAANIISMGDLVDTVIHINQEWQLLTSYGIISSVCPTFYSSGGCKGRLMFSSWLGQNSRRLKNDRIITGIMNFLKPKISATKSSFVQSYVQGLHSALTEPLLNYGLEGINTVMDTLNYYDFNLEDMDALLEAKISYKKKAISPQVKKALTREYKKKFSSRNGTSATKKRGVIHEEPTETQVIEQSNTHEDALKTLLPCI